MKKFLSLALVLVSSAAFAATPTKSSDFKGESPQGEWTFAGLTGLSIIGTGGFGVSAMAAKKIIHRGFVPDLANQVWIEAQFGPVFGYTGVTAWAYSAHLRWDFAMDSNWTFYALGGAGGDILSTAATTSFHLFPRFGTGVFYYFDSHLALRGELSHEQTMVGVSYRL